MRVPGSLRSWPERAAILFSMKQNPFTELRVEFGGSLYIYLRHCSPLSVAKTF